MLIPEDVMKHMNLERDELDEIEDRLVRAPAFERYDDEPVQIDTSPALEDDVLMIDLH